MNSRLALVSIVIPVYGVEEYLDRCVQSVVDQDYKNLEIILVDDGSPDHCPEMCDEWAKRDARIVVVHKRNGGLASARNAGLDAITGSMVTFVDSDDWIEPNFVSTMMQWKKDSGADVCMCGASEDDASGHSVNAVTESLVHQSDGKEALRLFLYHRRYTGPVWGKIFDSVFFTGNQAIRFHEGLNSEDYYVLVQVYERMKLIYMQTSTRLYHYCFRDGSICRSSNVGSHTFDEIEIANLCCRYLERVNYPDWKAINYFRMQGCADVMFALLKKNDAEPYLAKYVKQLRRLLIPVLADGYVPLAYKFKLCFLSLFPKLSWRVRQRRLKKEGR